MNGWSRLALATSAAAALFASSARPEVVLAASQWWPAGPEISSTTGNIGLAANLQGGFLLIGSGGLDFGEGQAAYCTPSGTLDHNQPGPGPLHQPNFGAVVSGSPTFEPDGTALVVSLMNPGVISKPVVVSEGPATAPQQLGPWKEIFASKQIGGPLSIVSATGIRGDIVVAGALGTFGALSAAIRLAGSSSWMSEQFEAHGLEPALAVDGLGDTTLLWRNPGTNAPGETASAFFAPVGGSFESLTVPVPYFQAVAANAAGGSAIAGYTPTGPLGPGLYLSRRESPTEHFGTPILVSASSHDQNPQLAYDAAGDLTVAWADGDHMNVAVAAPGKPLGPTQTIHTPATTPVSDARLAVDPAGEAVLAWAAGPHEMWSESARDLYGVPTPIYAAIRPTDAEPFQAPQLITTSALYSEGLNPHRREFGGTRIADAIGAGRALVAWPTNGPNGPLIETALHASTPGCHATSASPPKNRDTRPLLTGLSETAKVWREGRKLPEIGGRMKKLPIGTTFSFSVNQPASVTFTFSRSARGRKLGGQCVAQIRSNKGRRRCTRFVPAGTLRFSAHVGTNRVRFAGVISRRRRLKPGNYAVLVRATVSSEHSTPEALRFTIAKG